MLANEILKLALVGSIPVCGEVLWTELLGLINQFFCVLALFESVLQVIVSNTTTSFVPDWMTALLTPFVLMGRGNEATRSGSLRMRWRSFGIASAGTLRHRPAVPTLGAGGLESTTRPTSHNDGGGSGTSEVRRGATR